MTTLAILADIHGNLPALDAVRRDLALFAAQASVDQVVVAGDLINWGPFSAAVMQIAADEGWAMIRGNNEYYLLDYGTPRAPAEWSDSSRFPLLPWLAEQLNGRWHRAIAVMPDALTLRYPDAPPLRVVHGTPRSPWESMYPDTPEQEIAAALDGAPEEVVIAGHTHLPMDRRIGRWRVLNPGTVGVPIDGTHEARYVLLRTAHGAWRAEFRAVTYDQLPLFAEFERQRFTERCGVVGRLVVREFETARLQLHPFFQWRATHHPHAPADARLLEAFEQVDARPYMPPAYRW